MPIEDIEAWILRKTRYGITLAIPFDEGEQEDEVLNRLGSRCNWAVKIGPRLTFVVKAYSPRLKEVERIENRLVERQVYRVLSLLRHDAKRLLAQEVCLATSPIR